MGFIDKAGKKALTKLPDLKLLSLARETMPYVSAEAEGLSFFFGKTDHSIIDYMVGNKKLWAREEMDFILGYFEDLSVRPGVLLDIGANVGTSVIYFRSKLGSGCKYYAVEPVTENYNLLNANCAINGFYDINTYRCGISDASGEANMQIDPENMATCKIAGSDNDGLVFEKSDAAYVGEAIKLVTLDGFVEDNKVPFDSPILFWIDVEGHEPEVLRSGLNTFRNTDSVVFCEYNPKLYKSNGRYESFISDIKQCFSRFVCYESAEPGKYQFRDIGELDKVAEENNMNQCNLLLVK